MRDIYDIDTARLQEEFCHLVNVDAVTFRERRMADTLKEKWGALGIELVEDGAGRCYRNRSDGTGNLYGLWRGTLPGEPLLFSAHMDTVEPGIGKEAVVQKDGRITSGGMTVLGADDAAGLVSILEAVRYVQEHDLPHRDIELLFPIAEEAYTLGSSAFDFSGIRAKEAYVLDLSGPVGTASLREPTLIAFQVRICGKAAHAGFAPEKGVNAIAVAAEAISRIRQGRVGEDTTVNIGEIVGGTAANIVPEKVLVKGEIRSYRHERALELMGEIGEIFRRVAESAGAQVQVEEKVHLTAYHVEAQEPVVQRFLGVCERLELPSELTQTFGGSDNNSFLKNGIRGIVLSCGMNQVHTTEEYTTIEELRRCTAICIGLMTEEGKI